MKNKKAKVIPMQQPTGSISIETLLTEQSNLDKQIQQINQALSKLDSDRNTLITRQHALAGAQSYNASLIQSVHKKPEPTLKRAVETEPMPEPSKDMAPKGVPQ